MNESVRQQLVALRKDILNNLAPLLESSNFDPAQKFELLLAAARISDDPNKFQAAYEAVKQIEAADLKADALLDLLDAIDEATASATQDDVQGNTIEDSSVDNDHTQEEVHHDDQQ